MRTEDARSVRLSNYRPPYWLVETVDLHVSLHETATRVRSRLKLKPNPQADAPGPLALDGEDLTLISIRLDGVALSPDSYALTSDGLTIPQPPRGAFTLEIETQIDPTANTQLSGLYRSSGNYCTQCEAEGFRRITYFPDRPDVMAIYTTRVEAAKAEAPILLSNGNLVESGDVAGSERHFAVWHDPHPKPAYLFALVGGRLGMVEDAFVTMSGRRVTLRIFVEPGKENRCAWAMDSLKRSMKWDEEAFGREYDLDIFMIVAVSDFNMGAMENKGLNVFNDKLVLASPDTATDGDYASIEAVIAHEYFHNWTGNRITCRDWFQLCLKEGLTVFREQEFTSDQRSRSVKRISDVRLLRAHQFIEDAGPLAHPVRPEVYREINNFYTPTVYEKGSEVIRMLKALLGADDFRRGMDLYFTRHDGDAATIEQFVACFAQAAHKDLTQFMRWYRQAGTPELAVATQYDAAAKTCTIDVTQIVPPTPGQPVKEPMVIPLALGLLGADGDDLPLTLADGSTPARGLVTLDTASKTFVFTGLEERPVPSLNRGFAAPVKLTTNLSAQDTRFLAAHDRDPFNRWQAVQTLATTLLIANVAAHRAGKAMAHDDGLAAALTAILADRQLEPAYVALALAMPSEVDIARDIATDVDPLAIYAARTSLRMQLGATQAGALRDAYGRMASAELYSPDAGAAGRRALKTVCLDLLAAAGGDGIALAARQYHAADNMTDRMAALLTLSVHDTPDRDAALADFYARFESNALVIDKWFSLQAMIPDANTLGRVQALTRHPAFSLTNPNRVRALVGAFAHSNQSQFNRADGEGYQFVADIVLELNARNPQVASRMATSFRSWRALEPARRAHAQSALRRIADAPDLSRDVKDIVDRSLAGD